MFLFLILLSLEDFNSPQQSENCFQLLQELKENPISLNTATKQELAKLFLLTPEMVDEIIKKRKERGGFKKIEEIKEIEGIDEELFLKIKEYLTLTPFPFKYKFKFRNRSEIKFPLKNSLSPRKLYLKGEIDFKKNKFLILIEKDPTEQYYLDFVSCGMEFFNPIKGVNRLILGNYKLSFGEELIFGSPLTTTFKKSGIIKKTERWGNLYNLVGEGFGLKGIYMEGGSNSFSWGSFFSKNEVESKVKKGRREVEYNYDTSFYKRNSTEILYGGRVEYKGITKIGTSFYQNYYYYEGKRFLNTNGWGIDFSKKFKKIQMFGEVSNNNGYIVGMMFTHRGMKINSLYRNYPPKLFLPHSSAWNGNVLLTQNNGERGWYFYHQCKIYHKVISSYYFEYTQKLPHLSSEWEYFFQVECFSVFLFSCFHKSSLTKIKLQPFLPITKEVTFSLKMEKGWEEKKIGEVLSGRIKVKRGNFLLVAEKTLFSTEEIRFYEHEVDLRGVMKVNQFKGEGERFYILLREKINQTIWVELKYSRKEDKTYQEEYKCQIEFNYYDIMKKSE